MATMTFKLDKEYIDELRQLVSDVNDANLYSVSQLEERIDSLEERIEKMERKLNHKSIETSGESIKISDESLKSGGAE